MIAHALRVAAAAVLVWLAVYGVAHHDDVHDPVDPPDAMTLDKLAPVAQALRSADAVDRALWAQIWEKVAKVVASDADDPLFSDTVSLRAFNVACLNIAWHRIAGNKPGKYRGLREATEAFLADPEIMGRDDVTMTEDVKKKWAKAAMALAYAGTNRG